MQKSPMTAPTDDPGLLLSRRPDARSSIRFPLAVLLIITGTHLLLNLGINEGHLTYTLDDTYIHMALAEGIAHGHFGINPGETSAPSSSILWPFLLAPFMLLPVSTLIPFAINLISAIATVVLMVRTLEIGFTSAGADYPGRYAGWLVAALIPITNIVGLIFSGMEHSLQLLLTAAIVYGLVNAHRYRRLPWWLPVALIAGPLIRYEMYALTLPAVVYLYLCRHRLPALTVALTAAALTAAYSWYLASLGLGAMPTSISLRSNVVSSGGSLATIFNHFRENLSSGQGALLAIAFTGLLAVSLSRTSVRTLRLLAAWGAVGVLMHFLFGRFGGWYHARYEMYVLLSTLLLTAYLASAPLGRFLQRIGGVRLIVIAVVAIVAVAFPRLHRLTDLHLASSNIYQQQYQIHRFVTEFYRGAVAVNDIGWVAFQNEHTVVDLVGLAHRKNMERRARQTDSRWMSQAAAEGGARLAMIYDSWFPFIPDSWTPIADLHLGHRRVSAADDRVTFYALDPAVADSTRELLARFALTLPEGVRLELRYP